MGRAKRRATSGSLPEQGAWLQPFRPLSSSLTSRI
jgi:hypothetical protein